MNHSMNKIGASTLALVGLIGSASAATVSSKDGMQTTTSAYTQSDSGLPILAPGVQELGLSGRLNWEDDTAYNFDISYGRFVTANWMLGVSGGITGVNSDKDYRAGVFGEYNFLTGTKWVPFVRGTLGYSKPNNGDDSGTAGLDFGVKYFLSSNLAVFGSFGGDWEISGDNGGDDGLAKQIDLGLRFYF